MRGDERVQGSMFSYLRLEQRVPADHPLREIRRLTDGVLQSLDAEFDKLYAATGRASIAPEYVLRALLLQAFYSIRSQRQLVEQIDYDARSPMFIVKLHVHSPHHAVVVSTLFHQGKPFGEAPFGRV